MVVFQEVGDAAVDAHAITLPHDPALARRGMAMPSARVDGPPLRVVNQRSQERSGSDSFDD
jgi:hypothetical protein